MKLPRQIEPEKQKKSKTLYDMDSELFFAPQAYDIQILAGSRIKEMHVAVKVAEKSVGFPVGTQDINGGTPAICRKMPRPYLFSGFLKLLI